MTTYRYLPVATILIALSLITAWWMYSAVETQASPAPAKPPSVDSQLPQLSIKAPIVDSPAPPRVSGASSKFQGAIGPSRAGKATSSDPILFDQTYNPNENTVSSQNFEPALDAYDSQAADDFTVPPGETWTVTEVEVSGAYKNSGWADSINVFFYETTTYDGSFAKLPGAPVLSQTNTIPTYGLELGNFILPVEPALTLTEGTYWLSVQANEDLYPNGQWYWRTTASGAFNQSAWRNPGGGYGRSNCTNRWGERAFTCSIAPYTAEQVFRLRGLVNATPTNTATATGTPPSSTPTPTVPPSTPTPTGEVEPPPPPILTYPVPVDTATPTPTTETCGPNSNYVISQSSGATLVPGTALVAGSQCDSCTVNIGLPFTYFFYGQPYTSTIASNYGTMAFTTHPDTSELWDIGCAPDYRFNEAIWPYWVALSTSATVSPTLGIYTSTSGVAPNRVFNIEWRACGLIGENGCEKYNNFEVRLYEGQGKMEFVYGTDMFAAFQDSTIGVQNADRSRHTLFSCNVSNSFAAGTKLTVAQPECPTTPTVTGTPPTATRTPTNTRHPTRTPLPSYTPTNTSTATPTPPPCGVAWRIVPTERVSPDGSKLRGVHGVSANDVWAVGEYWSGTEQRPLIQHWNGSAWSTVPSPNLPGGYLETVHARAANDVWAVGVRNDGDKKFTLAVHWDGVAWTVKDTPNPGSFTNYLYSVVAFAADDAWAVGYYYGGNASTIYLILHWDGTAWTQEETGPIGYQHSFLLSISGSAPDDIWAVGHTGYSGNHVYKVLLFHWDGVAWTVASDPTMYSPYYYHFLGSVVALAPNDAWAVGARGDDLDSDMDPLTLHWNGTEWSIRSTPHNIGHGLSELYSVTGTGSNDVWAVGRGDDGHVQAMHWNGTQWSLQTIPGAGLSSLHNAAFALAPDDVWAVGHSMVGRLGTTGKPHSLIERYSNPDICQPSRTPTPTPTRTVTRTVTRTPTSTRTITPTASPSRTALAGSTHTAVPTAEVCSVQFSDVAANSPFYTFVRCLACKSILGGYSDGTFQTNNPVTRGQLSKIVSNAAGFGEPAGAQMFEDMAPDSPFYEWVQRLARRGHIGGYPCGAENEPCNASGQGNLPYFRPGNNASRGQISKIVANTAGFTEAGGTQLFSDVQPGSPFYDFVNRLTNRGIMSGYPCGGPGEPCNPGGEGDLPYFRPNNNATRGQASKIVANTFFPGCNP